MVMLVVSAELLTPAGPAGAAREPLPEKAREAAAIVRLAGDTKRDAAAAVKQVQLKTAAAVLEEPFAPVPESEAVDDTYFEDAVFLGEHVIKYHRTVTTYVESLLREGFTLRHLVEPAPPEEMRHLPGMADEMRRPMMLLLSAHKPA